MIVSDKRFFLLLVMVVAALLSAYMKPTVRLAEGRKAIELQRMIPSVFSGWHEQKQEFHQVVDPQKQAVIDRIYNQTLSRVYTHPKGDHIMLSIAYGGNQGDAMQVHKPEVCYPAQGFNVLKKTDATVFLEAQQAEIPVRRLVTARGTRVETVSYWMTVGDKVTANGWDQKISQLKYGFSGVIPDGLLFRVSSIGGSESEEYARHDRFINELVSSMTTEDRMRLTGRSGK